MAVKFRHKTSANAFDEAITLLEPSDVAPIDLTGQTVSLLTLVKALGTSGTQYAKYICKTDGGSANITGRPTTNNAGFVCEVLCNRWVSTNDYRYILRLYQQNDTNAFLSEVNQGTTTISWTRTNTNTDTQVSQDSTTTSNYRPLMLGLTNNANPSSFASTTGAIYYNVNLYAKPSDGSLYAKTIYENGIALSAKYLSLAGGAMAGSLTIKGGDLNLGTTGTSSDDSGDIVFKYGSGQEKSRIWTNQSYTTALGPNYRVYKSDGTPLYEGRLATVGEIPTVNNGTLTIQKNGSNVATFTANSSTNSTANIIFNYSEISAGTISNALINTHPEGSTTTIAYYTNDLVNLFARGGSCTAVNKTTGATITAPKAWFDGTPTYGGFSVSATTDVVEIVVVSPVSYSWSTHFGIGFGASAWRAKDVKIESGRYDGSTTVWKTVYNVTNSSNELHDSGRQSGPDGANGVPWNRIRITLTNFTGTSPRIAQIWSQNYDSKGLALNFVQTGGSTMYGSLASQNVYPKTTNTYDLGTTSYYWNNAYIKTIYENGTALSSKYLGISSKAADADKLDGQDSTYYLDYTNLTNKPALGTAASKNSTTSVTQNSNDLVTSGAVWTAIDNLSEPMVFKGTLGTNGTITSLPTASASNEGYTYKVITAGTYASQSAKVGDVFVSNGSAWVIIPAGDDVEDTWRNIKVNDTELLGTGISTGAINFKNGGNITVTGSGNNITLGVASGYSIPSTTNQTAWSAKYNKPSGGIPASDLAESYYLASNPNNYTSVVESTVSGWGFTKNAGTVTSVDSVSPSSGNVALSAVRYVSQTLTDTQKTQARTNIGAGTSNFTGYTSSNKLSTDYINNVAGWTSNTGTVTSVKVGSTSYSPTSGVISLPAYPTDTNYYPSRSYSSGLQISTSTNVTNTCALYVPYATADQYGVVKPAAVRSSAITATTGGTTSDRYYGVEKDSNGKLFVNVPWSSSGTTTWNSDWGYTLKSYQGSTFGSCYYIDCPSSYAFGCGDSGFFIDAKSIADGATESDNMLLVSRDEGVIVINKYQLTGIGIWNSSEGQSWDEYQTVNFPSVAGTFAVSERTCGYATCATASSTAVKEVALYNKGVNLVDGSMFLLYMAHGNTNTSMSFSIAGLKTFSISNIYVNDSAMSSSYYAFPSGTYLCAIWNSQLYCYPISLNYTSSTTSTSTSHVIYKGTFSTNGSVTAIATMFHNFKKVVTVYGTEKSQYGTIRIYRGSSEIVAQATGEQGYWAKQDLCLTAVIPAGMDAYLYKTSNMNNLTYYVEVIS